MEKENDCWIFPAGLRPFAPPYKANSGPPVIFAFAHHPVRGLRKYEKERQLCLSVLVTTTLPPRSTVPSQILCLCPSPFSCFWKMAIRWESVDILPANKNECMNVIYGLFCCPLIISNHVTWIQNSENVIASKFVSTHELEQIFESSK